MLKYDNRQCFMILSTLSPYPRGNSKLIRVVHQSKLRIA